MMAIGLVLLTIGIYICRMDEFNDPFSHVHPRSKTRPLSIVGFLLFFIGGLLGLISAAIWLWRTMP